jgi:hypothetical protein
VSGLGKRLELRVCPCPCVKTDLLCAVSVRCLRSAPSEELVFASGKVVFDGTEPAFHAERNLQHSDPVFDHRASARKCASHLV